MSTQALTWKHGRSATVETRYPCRLLMLQGATDSVCSNQTMPTEESTKHQICAALSCVPHMLRSNMRRQEASALPPSPVCHAGSSDCGQQSILVEHSGEQMSLSATLVCHGYQGNSLRCGAIPS